MRQREVSVEQTAPLSGSEYPVGIHAFQTYQAAFIDDAFELTRRIQKTTHGLPVFHFFGNDSATAQRRENALRTHSFPRGFRQKQITAMIEKRTFVEMTFETVRKKIAPAPFQIGTIAPGREPILLMHHRISRQYLERFKPCSVHGFILGGCHGKKFGQRNPVSDRHVCILAYNTSPFDG